jgi:tetratricopeptide (TPR) repeat protein
VKVRISGRAAAFAIKRSTYWEIGKRGSKALYKVGASDVDRVLGRQTDVVEIDAKAIVDIERRLEAEWSKDRAVRLAVILLDPSEDDAGLDHVAALLEALLGRDYVVEHLENQFYQKELPCDAALARALAISGERPALKSFFESLADHQGTISEIRESYEALPEELFSEDESKDAYRESVIAAGGFRCLVRACREGPLTDAVIFNLHSKLARLPHSRQFVGEWTSAFDRIRNAVPPLNRNYVEDFEDDLADFGGGPGGHQQLRNALEQQHAILERVAAGDFDNARRFAHELEQQQLATGGAQYLVKSMTRLSQRARDMEAFELELEWAYKAIEHQPDDARARTKYADALLQADDVDQALEQFEIASDLGERAYAATGRARVMRKLGKYSEELKLYEEAANLFSGSDEEIYCLVGIATAKHDLGYTEDAFIKLRDAIEKFPYEPLCRVSLARMLMRHGRFQEAWDAFTDALTLTEDNLSAANGLADICHKVGRLTEARTRYAQISVRYPRDIRAHVGLIDTLRSMGDGLKAAIYARKIAERFPGSPTAAAKHAETSSELGRYPVARQILNDAIARFPRNARLLLVKARGLRRQGKYDRALEVVDGGLARFPYNRRFKVLRAEMLRRLGQRNAAEALYRELVETDQADVRARNGLASMLALAGKEDSALALIGNDDPKTNDDWRSFLLVASILDRKGDSLTAYERWEWGYQNCPFAAERRLFSAALANHAIRSGRARRAPLVMHVAERDIANIIDFHVAAMTKQERAKKAYGALSRNLPARLEPLRDEIAKTYGIVDGRPAHTKSWILRAVNDEFLLAAA